MVFISHSNHSNKAICEGSFSLIPLCPFSGSLIRHFHYRRNAKSIPHKKYKKTTHKTLAYPITAYATGRSSFKRPVAKPASWHWAHTAEHWPAKAPSRTALRPGGKSSVKTSQNARCVQQPVQSGCRCCWHAIKFHFSPLHNCRVWQCLKLIMWSSLLLHLLLFVWCAFLQTSLAGCRFHQWNFGYLPHKSCTSVGRKGIQRFVIEKTFKRTSGR